MNRTLGAVLCLGTVAAVGMAATPTQAEVRSPGCRVAAGKPFLGKDGKIHATGSRTGCADSATFRVRLWKALTGPDRVVKSGAKVIRNGRLTLSSRCASGVFSTTVTDYRGHVARSRWVRLSCAARLENEVVRLTNAERRKAGCGPLTHDARLRAAARRHSADMSARNYFEHTSPDGRSVADRVTAAGYSWTAVGENIAKGYPTAAAVVRAWMTSPGHRQNILNCAYTDIGVGYVKSGGRYWTQDFGRH